MQLVEQTTLFPLLILSIFDKFTALAEAEAPGRLGVGDWWNRVSSFPPSSESKQEANALSLSLFWFDVIHSQRGGYNSSEDSSVSFSCILLLTSLEPGPRAQARTCRQYTIVPINPSMPKLPSGDLHACMRLQICMLIFRLEKMLIVHSLGAEMSMRGRSSRQGSKRGRDIDKLKEEPHLSGAYIRSLVKQLTSSRTKEPPMSPKDPAADTSVDGDEGLPLANCHQNSTKVGEGQRSPSSQPIQPPQQHKKQVRRRLHTSRPYQERLLNMAEARREIVTALKFHRAAMKQANEQAPPQQQPQSQPLQPPAHQQSPLQAGKLKSRSNPRIYPSSCKSNFSNHLENISYSNPNYSWPASQIAPPAFITENLNLSLPNQTLGLNLNYHDFTNLDATLYHSGDNPSIYSSFLSPSSSSASPSPSLSVATDQQFQHGTPVDVVSDVAEPPCDGGGLDLHPSIDDEGMEEIRSIGEQYEMEWNDTLNLVTSAWWLKFLKNTQTGTAEDKGNSDDDQFGYHPLIDEIVEFPTWLNANDSCLHQHYLDDHSDDYLQDSALPCMDMDMDIGEIEGIDGEWLA